MFLPFMLRVSQGSATENFTNHIQHFSLKSTMMEQLKYSSTIQQPILIIQHKIISTSQPMYADSQKIKPNALWMNLKHL